MIFTAVVTNNIKLTELLIGQYKCDLHIKDYDNKTPLDYAKLFKHKKIEKIIENNVDMLV